MKTIAAASALALALAGAGCHRAPPEQNAMQVASTPFSIGNSVENEMGAAPAGEMTAATAGEMTAADPDRQAEAGPRSRDPNAGSPAPAR